MRLFRRRAVGTFIWVLALLAPVLYAQSNTIKNIHTAGGNVEITVGSAQEFDVRDEVVALKVGSHIFSTSRSSADGDTRTLIFVLTQDEWDSLATGDAITLGWGSDATGNPRNFGTLDKSLLNK